MNERYWEQVYGKRSRDFIDGVKAGVRAFAVWKNGEETVGAMRRPLKEELKEIEEQLWYKEKGESSG